jgi:SPP1 gp7 family putative phage head morphogenesis protein
MISLKPIREKASEFDEIESKIKILFKKEIYLPLIREFSSKATLIKNAKSDLFEALRTGRITFNRGKFSGKFSATTSKELKELGAKWNRKENCFSIPKSSLPPEVQVAISSSSSAFSKKLYSIDQKLAAIVPEELASQLKISHLFDQTLWKVEHEFQKSIKNITIAPKMSSEQAKRISDEWQNNMQIWIKDFTEKEIKSLRENIQKSVFAGNRYESAIQMIQKSYGVTSNKAKFLARQETALLMAKHKEIKYQSAGIDEYKWQAVSGTPLHPVRPRHKALSDASQAGKIFRFDDPPISDLKTGARNNPGEDYNCRCVAVPVVRFRK